MSREMSKCYRRTRSTCFARPVDYIPGYPPEAFETCDDVVWFFLRCAEDVGWENLTRIMDDVLTAHAGRLHRADKLRPEDRQRAENVLASVAGSLTETQRSKMPLVELRALWGCLAGLIKSLGWTPVTLGLLV